METKNINGLIVLDKQTVDEIIAWCEQDKFLRGGRVDDIEKRLSDSKDGYKDVSLKRWHFEKSGTIFGLYTYCYVDIQALLLDNYVAAIEVGVRREGEEDMKYPTILHMYESIRDVNDLKGLLRLAWNVIKTGHVIVKRQHYLDV